MQPQSRGAGSRAGDAGAAGRPDRDQPRGRAGASRGATLLPPLVPGGRSARVKHSFVGASTPVFDFDKIGRVGEGTYGIVYKARDRRSGAIVALKRVRMEHENEGMPVSSLREISLLRTLRHDNIVSVVDVAVGAQPEDIFLVMEYCDFDLANVMDTMVARGRKSVYQPAEVKCLIQQILRGVEHLHRNHIIHRDLKLSNLLLTAQGILKVADFGLARTFSAPAAPLTPRVVTLWYRSPELLLGASTYTTAIDMWSVGCIFGELLRSEPLLPGKIERHQLELICKLLGSPTPAIWPEITELPFYPAFRFPAVDYDSVRAVFSGFSDATQRLLKSLLVYRPQSRLAARDALRHPYFTESPRACAPVLLPTFPEVSNPAQAHINKQQALARQMLAAEQHEPQRSAARDAADPRHRSIERDVDRGMDRDRRPGVGGGGGAALAASQDTLRDLMAARNFKRRRFDGESHDRLFEVGMPVFRAFADD